MHDHSVQLPPLSDDAVTKVYAEEVITSFRQQMQETERLAEELKDLLKSYEAGLENDQLRDQTETLIGWAQCYRHGLQAADKMFQTGNSWLAGLETRLKTEADMARKEEKCSYASQSLYGNFMKRKVMAG